MSKVVVPNSAVSQLIGKQGQTIKELQEATGTKIQISNRYENQSSSPDLLFNIEFFNFLEMNIILKKEL